MAEETVDLVAKMEEQKLLDVGFKVVSDNENLEKEMRAPVEKMKMLHIKYDTEVDFETLKALKVRAGIGVDPPSISAKVSTESSRESEDE